MLNDVFQKLTLAVSIGGALTLSSPLAAQAQATPPAAPTSAEASLPVIQPAPAVSSPQPGAPAISLGDGYVLGIGDVIEVALVGPGDYSARVQVQNDGTVPLPYIGSIEVKDKTVLQVRDAVARKLLEGGYYKDPVVSVVVATYASRYVVVLGQVGTPGIVPIDRAYRLSEVLARVGGTRETGADIVTLRRPDGQELNLPIERVAIGGVDSDPPVNPGDKIYVGPAPTFYIYGQVRTAGNYKVAPGMTVRMALGQGGGLTDRGSEKKVKLFRGGEEVKIDMTTQIKGGDVLVVGERFF